MKSFGDASAATVLLGAAFLGTIAGVGSITPAPDALTAITSGLRDAAVATGFERARSPRPGDYWTGCNDARASGATPIYVGEPGYRPAMDGDGDGVACEPYRP